MAETFNYTREWTDEKAFPLLGFSRDWNNPEDYPTVELDERKVREDMQSLHDEVKDYLNEHLIPAVIAEEATVEDWAHAESTRVEAENGRAEAEILRVTAEQNRSAAEIARAEAEQNRSAAEIARVEAEQARVDVNSGVVAQATAQALSAKESADSATNSATDARAYNTGGLLADGSTRVNGSAWYADKAKAYAEGGTYTEYNPGGFPVTVTAIGAEQHAFYAAESADAAGASQAAAKISEDNAKYWAEQAQGAVGGDFAARDLSNVTNAVFLAKAEAAGVGGGSGGSGDMASSVYDPTGKQTDIFAFAQGAASTAESNANTYTNQKIAALPTPDVSGQISAHNTSATAHDDIRQLIAGKKSASVYEAVIGTSWVEDGDTGVKTQTVVISGVTSAHTAKVDHSSASVDGTSNGYATFAEEENQYLTYITNGFAETVAGGIKFTIFGDSNTVSIPIVAEVV